jgi:hypothetical protein
MTGSSGVSSTPQLFGSITGVSGILGRPVKPGDDSLECGDRAAPQRAVIASDAKQSMEQQERKSGLLRGGACHRARIRATRWLLAMTVRRTFATPRRDAPGWCLNSSPCENEGVGNAGRPMHPQPRVRILVVSMHTSIHSEPPEITRHSRTQWFTAYSVLSPATGFLATVISGSIRKLDASTGASGPHDFAVRYISALVSRTISVHRIPPRVRDDRERPSIGARRREIQN